MLFHKARDKKVAVIETRLMSQFKFYATRVTSRLKQLGLELLLQKIIRRALIDEQRIRPGAIFD